MADYNLKIYFTHDTAYPIDWDLPGWHLLPHRHQKNEIHPFRQIVLHPQLRLISRKRYSSNHVGLQVFGKSTPFVTSLISHEVQAPVENNKFDFQVYHDRNLNYTWALYGINHEGFEERLETKKFSIKEEKDKYIAGGCKTGKDDTCKFNIVFPNSKIEIDFILMIQNTSYNTILLTEKIISQPEEDRSKIKSPETTSMIKEGKENKVTATPEK